MFELYEIAAQKDSYASIRDMLIELRDIYRYDVIMAIQFSQDKNHPYVRIGCKKNGQTNDVEYNYLIEIDDFAQSFFSLMCDEKKVAVCSSDLMDESSKYIPFDAGAKSEIYFPLFEDDTNDVIGCVYLSAQAETTLDHALFLADYRLDILGCFAGNLYKDMKNSNQIISFLKLFDDFLIKNNPHMLRHHYNVAFLSSKVGDELNLSDEEKDNLYFASLLHDIGEIYINGSLLNKKDKLSETEYKLEQQHVMDGADLIKQIFIKEKNRDLIADAILQHHERYDGKGYPEGLKGKDICLPARIISVADAVDSMLSKRSYKASKTMEETIQDLKANKGQQFDPKIVDAMIKVLYERTSAKLKIKEIPIMLAALNVGIEGNERLIQGMLIPQKNVYEFHLSHSPELELVEWAKDSIRTLYIVANQDVYELNAKLKEVKNGIVYLVDMESKYTMISYSLFWELQGMIDMDEVRSIPVKATRISGDALTFMASEDVADSIQANTSYTLRIYFDKDDPEMLTGMVTQRFKTGNDFLFFFNFENVQESVKERIFRRIVRKQADLKVSYLFDSN